MCSMVKCIDPNNPPTIAFYGEYIGYMCPYETWAFEEFYALDGEYIEFFPSLPGPYGSSMLALKREWAVIIHYCHGPYYPGLEG
jgi:hypothetical protein